MNFGDAIPMGASAPLMAGVDSTSALVKDTLAGVPTMPIDMTKSVTDAALGLGVKSGDNACSIVDNNVMPAPDFDGGNDRLAVVLPRSAATLIKNGKISNTPNDITRRGPAAAIRLLVNKDVKHQTIVNGINFAEEFKFLTRESGGFQNFLLTHVDTSFNEKVQIQTTFGDNEVVYYFGRDPMVFNLSGMLFDSLESEWFTKFISLYMTTLRGSMLAKNYELVEIVLPNIKIIGSIMSLGYQQDSTNDASIGFNMQVLAKEMIPLPMPMGIDSIRRLKSWQGDGTLLSFKDLAKTHSAADVISALVSRAPTSKTLDGIFSSMGLGSDGKIAKGLAKLVETANSVFSPVYGVLSAITKVVSESGASIAAMLSQFTDPVNSILRDINNIAGQAVALSNLIDKTLNDVMNIPNRMIGNLNDTLSIVKNAAGVISRMPETMSQSMARLHGSAKLNSNAAILGGGNKASAASKVPLLKSGSTYTPAAGYKL